MKKVFFVLTLSLFIFNLDNQTKGDCDCGPTFEEQLAIYIMGDYLIEKGKPEDTYAPWRVYDNNPNTSWVEGEGDEGINSWIQIVGLSTDKIYGIEILSGVAADEEIFKKNNRPKKLLFEFISSSDDRNSSNYIIFSKELLLKDKREFQRFLFGKSFNEYIKQFDLKHNTKTMLVGLFRIVIKEVYRGTKYNDTGISEIRFLDRNGNSFDLFKNERKRNKRKK